MVSALISKLIMMVFGTLYPAYCSYKAIKNKDLREYVKWMMYWIIYAFFITGEVFADIFLSWLPLYYEIKIIFIIWLLSPATKGSSILYRKFVHPRLQRHEKNIDRYITHAKKSSYSTLMDVGRRGFNVATDTFMKTAVTGQYQILETLRKYNSMQELNTAGAVDNVDNRPSLWYDRPPSSNFNPEDDIDILQQQYRPASQNLSEGDETIRENMHRSYSQGSEMNRSGDLSESMIAEDDQEDTLASPVAQYSSNTLPRVKRPRKPIYETMPTTTATTRARRSTRQTNL